MTPEQKLEIVYKKLFNGTASTKNGTKFFEEPFRAFSQVPLSHVYINSDYIPATASQPPSDIVVNGKTILKYVNNEVALPFNSEQTTFVARNTRIIPFSYGEGYGITIRTQSGTLIDPNDFPYLVDWESGKIQFDVLPFDVDNGNPPLLSYYYYSSDTLETISGSTQQGPRGAIGPTGDTGPEDVSVLMYKGETDFSVSPPVQYIVNDVITFTTNGNSYICTTATTQSPAASPGSWELLTIQGTQSEVPGNVLFVNHPNAILTSTFQSGNNSYYSSLQDAINAAPDGVATLIFVNSFSNLTPSSEDVIEIVGKDIHLVFRKWANISSKNLNDIDFRMRIKDSNVIIENAQIGGTNIFGTYPKLNDLKIESVQAETTVKFIECKVNLKNITCTRSDTYNATMVFERTNLNATIIVTNGDFILKDSTFSGSITANYTGQDVIGKKHVFNIIRSFGFQLMGVSAVKDAPANGIAIVLDRDDVINASIKFENCVTQAVGIKLLPEVTTDSPCTIKVDANNSTFFFFGLDDISAVNSGVIELIGLNISFGALFDNPAMFSGMLGGTGIRYYTSGSPLISNEEIFTYRILINATTFKYAVKTLAGSQILSSYFPYKNLMIQNVGKAMLSL